MRTMILCTDALYFSIFKDIVSFIVNEVNVTTNHDPCKRNYAKYNTISTKYCAN